MEAYILITDYNDIVVTPEGTYELSEYSEATGISTTDLMSTLEIVHSNPNNYYND